MSFLLKIENIAKSSKILISVEPFFSRSKDRSRTHDQKFSQSFMVLIFREGSLRFSFLVIYLCDEFYLHRIYGYVLDFLSIVSIGIQVP